MVPAALGCLLGLLPRLFGTVGVEGPSETLHGPSLPTPNPQSKNRETRGVRPKRITIPRGEHPPRQREVPKLLDPGLFIAQTPSAWIGRRGFA